MYGVEEYKNEFDRISENFDRIWHINTLSSEKYDMGWIHTVGVKGEKETVFSTIRINRSEILYGSALAMQNFDLHEKMIGRLVCDMVPKEFSAFIKPSR